MKIKKWKEISEGFEGGSLILGNGASIAIDDSFAYPNLFRFTRDKRMISQDVIKIFEYFGMENFEYILRMLWHSYNINIALGIDGETPINKAYDSIKYSLINAIKDKKIHASYSKVSSYFNTIYKFLMGFETVVSLNYDLIVYWTIMYANDPKNTNIGQWFKDCFINGKFKKDWEFLREPNGGSTGSTLVFYPHGNLILKENIYGTDELKISRTDQTSLLDKFDEEWDDKHIPLFVSEGNPELKKSRIGKSTYLKNVYDKVLPHLGEKIVFHGWSMSEEDDHILEQISRNRTIKKIAVSIYKDNEWSGDKEKRIKEKFLAKDKIEWIFYDAESEGCWNNKRKLF